MEKIILNARNAEELIKFICVILGKEKSALAPKVYTDGEYGFYCAEVGDLYVSYVWTGEKAFGDIIYDVANYWFDIVLEGKEELDNSFYLLPEHIEAIDAADVMDAAAVSKYSFYYLTEKLFSEVF